MSHTTGPLSEPEVAASADHLASLQHDDGMIPWYPGGPCDPWNHVEAAMALDVAGRHERARLAYRWLMRLQRADGSWHADYRSGGQVSDPKLDTNVCAYVATGVWHHLLSTGDRATAAALWPMVERALDWVLTMRRPDGTMLWACQPDASPWDYALLTGSSSVVHSLRSGARLAHALGRRRPRWLSCAADLADAIARRPEAFAPKERWAMDWYYPTLSGAVQGPLAKARLAEGWATFVIEGAGVRCVSDEPWVTAAETAECALAHAVIGDVDTAAELLRWTRGHRRHDGAYWTGIVVPTGATFPADEVSSYTAAAVILASDAITGRGATGQVFTRPVAGRAATRSGPPG